MKYCKLFKALSVLLARMKRIVYLSIRFHPKTIISVFDENTYSNRKQVQYFYKSCLYQQTSAIPHEPSNFGASNHRTKA